MQIHNLFTKLVENNLFHIIFIEDLQNSESLRLCNTREQEQMPHINKSACSEGAWPKRINIYRAEAIRSSLQDV
jgi:hypothetical protein